MSTITLRRRWRRLCRELDQPDVELTCEEFSPLLSTFKLLRDAGERFDPALTALMNCLERQVKATDAGIEDDTDGDEDDDSGWLLYGWG